MTGDVKTITSFANPLVKKIKSLGLKKNRDEAGLFVAEGLRHTLEALEAGWDMDLVAFAGDLAEYPHLSAALEGRGGTRLSMTPEILEHVTSRDNAQRVVSVFRQRFGDASDIGADANGLWVALEEVRDPGNLGTIMRTADAVGASGIVLAGSTCDPFSPECIRASMGSFARMPVVKMTQGALVKFIGTYPGSVVGTHLKATHDYRLGDAVTPPALLVMGNEQAGLSAALSAACTHRVRIPMAGKADSLNLAVATGVMLYELRRGRI